MSSWAFFVAGRPVTQGSKKGYVVGGRVVLVEASGPALGSWREAIAWEARRARGPSPLIEGPVALRLAFAVARPASTPKRKRTWPIKRRSGDLDKSARAVFDALSGVLFVDDSQVQSCVLSKDWAADQGPGVSIEVWEVVG